MKWKIIENTGGKYMVSDSGQVINVERNKPIKLRMHEKGYHIVSLRIGHKTKNYLAHRLVAFAFIPIREGKHAINHIDGIKTNNDVSNLEWVTNKENTVHAWQTGLKKSHNNATAKLTQKQVIEIRQRIAAGVSVCQIAKDYSIHTSNIYRIKNKRGWKTT